MPSKADSGSLHISRFLADLAIWGHKSWGLMAPNFVFVNYNFIFIVIYICITTIENLLLFWGVRNEVVLLEFPWIWRMYFWCTFFSLVVGRRRKPDRILMGYFSRKCRKIGRYFTMSIVPVLYRLSSFLIAILIINGAKVCSGCSYIKTVLKIKHMGCIYIFRTFTSSYISYL